MVTHGAETQKRVHILEYGPDTEGRLLDIGALITARSESGELVLMAIDLRPSIDAEDLPSEQLLYLKKVADDLYHWAEFSHYVDCYDDMDTWLEWPENTVEEIATDEPAADQKLRRILEDAEKTIELVTVGKPIATRTWYPDNKQWRLENNVRPGRRGLRG
jgi:hypothetical protein